MRKQQLEELILKVSNYKSVNDFISNIRYVLKIDESIQDKSIENKILDEYNFLNLKLKKELNKKFIQTIQSILDDYVNLYRKLEIMKLYKLSSKSKDGVILILIFLDKMINYIKNDKEFNENDLIKIKDLFFLTDKNYFDIDKIKDDKQKKEIEEAIQKFYKGYKLDKISIIENLKKQIENLHIQKNQTVTFENLKTHTINSIIFTYKDFYNIKVTPVTKIEQKKYNDFVSLVSLLKKTRGTKKSTNDDVKTKKENVTFKESKTKEEITNFIESYLLFDSMTILDYSKISFLNRKLMIFFEDVPKQSKEFGKLKEDIKLTNDLINSKNNNIISKS